MKPTVSVIYKVHFYYEYLITYAYGNIMSKYSIRNLCLGVADN